MFHASNFPLICITSLSAIHSQRLCQDPRFHPSHIQGQSFVYLKSPRGLKYELELCTPDEATSASPSATVVTLSSEGLTWSRQGESPEYVTLAEFEREYFLYYLMRRRPFFR